MSASAPFKALTAARPPKPAPTTTMCLRAVEVAMVWSKPDRLIDFASAQPYGGSCYGSSRFRRGLGNQSQSSNFCKFEDLVHTVGSALGEHDETGGECAPAPSLVGNGRWFLGASTEWPGVVPADVEIGNLDELAQSYPTVAPEMRAIAAAVKVTPNPGAPLS